MTKFQECLAALGETNKSISAVLRLNSIKGRQRSACDCPIANYFKSCGFPHVSVGANASYFKSKEDEVPQESIRLSAGIRSWILQFDQGFLGQDENMEFVG